MQRALNYLILVSVIFFNFSLTQDVYLSLDGENLNYTSTEDIAGFQFNHDGCATGASGGDAAANGFTITGSSNIILAFSFTGSVIPSGSGTLVVLGTDECTSESLTNYTNANAVTLDVVFGSPEPPEPVAYSEIQEIFNQHCGNCHLGNSSGGLNLSSYNNLIEGGNSGDVIVPDDHVSSYLWERVDDGSMPPGNNPDLSGNQVNLIANWIDQGANPDSVAGCTDNNACNYNADATDDDGSCTYAEENYDCSGNCTAEVDCAGYCAGSAVVDECGDCNGDGIDDGACDCTGNILDECEICGGDGSSCQETTVDILYDSDVDIAGFQFDVDGVTGASGGAAANNGFTVSFGGNTVLGFSFTGAVIPAGEGVLTTITVSGSDACLSGVVVSGAGGTSLETSVEDCTTIVVGDGYSEPVAGCTDSNACNYNADATDDDE